MKRFLPSPRVLGLATLIALGGTLGGGAQAGEVYGNLGFPGVGLGYAHPLNGSFTVRGDWMTLGTHRRTQTEEGILYNGELKTSRFGLFADWFPFDGTFRLTGGVAATNYRLTLDASGAGGTLEIGDRTYTTTAADGINVQIKYPKTAPYLGIGWGHQANSGLRFAFDIGTIFAKPTVTGTLRGQLANEADAQANLDKELAELRDGAGKAKYIPQITFSVGYSF